MENVNVWASKLIDICTMAGSKIVLALLVFIIAGIMAILSFQSFKERGFLLNNAYIYATEEERKTMDTKPHYRQSAIVFCLISIVFIIIGLSIVSHNYRLELLEIPLVAGTIIYAVVSSVKINKKAGL